VNSASIKDMFPQQGRYKRQPPKRHKIKKVAGSILTGDFIISSYTLFINALYVF
jgi:hypothetical protein